jgi:hypothetical protein
VPALCEATVVSRSASPARAVAVASRPERPPCWTSTRPGCGRCPGARYSGTQSRRRPQPVETRRPSGPHPPGARVRQAETVARGRRTGTPDGLPRPRHEPAVTTAALAAVVIERRIPAVCAAGGWHGRRTTGRRGRTGTAVRRPQRWSPRLVSGGTQSGVSSGGVERLLPLD